MVTQRRGARWSCADAYLKPVLRRRKLTLLTEATATRVLFDGTRAVGVEFEHGGQRPVVRARREVVLCGGAINSPQLLMLSGIGDREQLAEHGIDFARAGPRRGRARRSSAREANQHCRNRRLRHRATASRPPAADTA